MCHQQTARPTPDMYPISLLHGSCFSDYHGDIRQPCHTPCFTTNHSDNHCLPSHMPHLPGCWLWILIHHLTPYLQGFTQLIHTYLVEYKPSPDPQTQHAASYPSWSLCRPTASSQKYATHIVYLFWTWPSLPLRGPLSLFGLDCWVYSQLFPRMLRKLIPLCYLTLCISLQDTIHWNTF